MRILVLFRGGVGDWFRWMTKLESLLLFHYRDTVDLGICSPWPEAILSWARANVYRMPRLDQIRILTPYCRPASQLHGEFALEGYDLVYHMDVWKGPAGAKATDHAMRPVREFFPWLEQDPYPQLDIPGDGVGGTVLQVEGASVGPVQTRDWWAEGLPHLPQPVRVLGAPPPAWQPLGQNVRGPVEIYAAIKDAELLVGCDSGMRCIALTTRTPVIEVETPGRGYPDYDVFVPPVYHDRWRLVSPDAPLSAHVGEDPAPLWSRILQAAGALLSRGEEGPDDVYPLF